MLKIEDVSKNDRWILKAFEVMKYDPIYRNSEGHYLKDEWSDFSDLGKKFNGIEFKYEDYKAIEDKYVNSVEYIFNFFNCTKIQFTKKRFFLESDLNSIRDKELQNFYQILKRRVTLNFSELQKAVRLVLRGAIIGTFYCKGNPELAVRFGYDFYMIFNVPIKENEIKDYIEKNIGLFTHR